MPTQLMTRSELVLAALAPANGSRHTPVQVQKLFFLIDREAAKLIGGPYFDFRAYHYGPFDKAVYKELEALEAQGLVEVGVRSYALTTKGQEIGSYLLGKMPKPATDYIVRASEFVRKLSFSQLVSAIYKEYPEMRANSVFQG